MTHWLPRRARMVAPQPMDDHAASSIQPLPAPEPLSAPQLAMSERQLLNRGAMFYATQMSDSFSLDHPLRRLKPSRTGAQRLVEHIFGSGSIHVPRSIRRLRHHLNAFQQLLEKFQALNRMSILDR